MLKNPMTIDRSLPGVFFRRIAGWRLIWTILITAAVGPAAGWSACLDASPTLASGKDPYASIAARDLSKAEQDTIRTLLRSLDGEWRGTAEALICRDLKDPNDNRRYTYTVNAEVETDRYGNLFLRKTLFSPEKRSTRHKILRLYLREARLRINTPSTAGDVELTVLEADRISFFYRLLLQNESGQGSIRKEIFLDLIIDENTFSLQQRTYSQGRLSNAQTQRFKRR